MAYARSSGSVASRRWFWFVVGVMTCGLPLHCHAIVTGPGELTRPGDESLAEHSVPNEVRKRSTETAVLQSGLDSFPRIEQASKMRAVFDSIIETETARIAAREKMKQKVAETGLVPVNDHPDQNVITKPTVATHPFSLPTDVELPGFGPNGDSQPNGASQRDAAPSKISLVSSSSESPSTATETTPMQTQTRPDWNQTLWKPKPTINPFFVPEASGGSEDQLSRSEHHPTQVATSRTTPRITSASMITNRTSKPAGPQPIVINKRMPARAATPPSEHSRGIVQAVTEIDPQTSSRTSGLAMVEREPTSPDAEHQPAPEHSEATQHSEATRQDETIPPSVAAQRMIMPEPDAVDSPINAFALPPLQPATNPAPESSIAATTNLNAQTKIVAPTKLAVASTKRTTAADDPTVTNEGDDWMDLLLTGAGRQRHADVDRSVDEAELPPLEKGEANSQSPARYPQPDAQHSQLDAHPSELATDAPTAPAAGTPMQNHEPTERNAPLSPQPSRSAAIEPLPAGADITLVPAVPSDATPEAMPSDVTLNVNEVNVRVVLEMLAKGYGLNLLIAPGVDGTVTANVSGLSPEKTLQGLVRMCGLAMQRDGDLILIYPKENLPLDARQIRVFRLDFARSGTVDPTVQTLLSPVGTAYASKVDETDNRQGCEAMVVIDVPEVIDQVERYLIEADQAPRQVLIEARVLEIELTDGMRHGVNLRHFNGGAHHGTFKASGNGAMSNNPFFFTDVNGQDLSTWLAMMQQTADAKTLATPQVMAVNGQTAKIQVGQQLGYSVATVTETSTIQDVRYLETGIVLQVTPTISRDDRVLLQVKPKVSSGEINPETRLPEETTREIETSVMLNNHQGMIIGGLIQEQDRVAIRKTPILGDVKHIGPLFQRRESRRSRSEIIVALIPHIIEPGQAEHCEFPVDATNVDDWEQAGTPLFDGPLNRNCRPWEAKLPDAASQGAAARAVKHLRNAHPYRR